MAIVKPFKGLLFNKSAGKIEDFVCPPYDIVDDKKYKQLLKKDKNNLIQIELPKGKEDRYLNAEQKLNSFIKSGILKFSDTDCFYIYEEKFFYNGEEKTLKGIVAKVQIEPFEKKIILPHENTLSAAKEDRFKLMCATKANISPIYSLYFDGGKNTLKTAEKGAKKLYSFKDEDNITHTLYKVAATDNISKDFEHRQLFIADGHHRYETALRYKNDVDAKSGNYIMMFLVPFECDGLVILPTHRVLHSMNNFSGQSVLKYASKFFDIMGVDTRAQADHLLDELFKDGEKSFIFYFDKQFYVFSLKKNIPLSRIIPNTDPSLLELDVTILHRIIFENILHIDSKKIQKQKNLKYYKDETEALLACDEGANCAFILNPTKTENLAQVASSGSKMPQKSTYFYPKPITGLVIHKF